jgi:hypothetical protein
MPNEISFSRPSTRYLNRQPREPLRYTEVQINICRFTTPEIEISMAVMIDQCRFTLPR